MSTYTRTPTTRTVTPLVIPASEIATTLAFVQEKVNPEITGVSFGPQWAIAFDAHDHLHAICDEGVGYEITDDSPLEIPVYWSIATENGQRSCIVPCANLTLSIDEIVEMQEKGDDGKPRLVPLGDWIRTFGARLDANYETWRRILEG